jgi:hypothetical protein
MLGQNEESKRHILCYKNKFEEARLRNEHILNIEMQRRNRETRDGSINRYERDHSAGSKCRNSLARDMTPNKMKTNKIETN